jgi:putative ABC transport system permease protein
VTSIVVRADDVSRSRSCSRASNRCCRAASRRSPAQRTTQDLNQLGDDFLNAFKTFLVIFAGIAMLVAAFSIHNTFSILVAQRTRESALLRTIGASRRQILTWVSVEALTLGLVASVAGLFGGIVLAQLLKALFASFGAALPSGGIAFEPSTVISLLAGVTITFLAGAVPRGRHRGSRARGAAETAVDRTRVPPADGHAGGAARRRHRARPLRRVAGIDRVGALGALATIVGVSVFGPVVAGRARVIGAPLPACADHRLAGPPQRCATARTAGTAPR